MNRHQLIVRLLSLPGAIGALEQEVHAREEMRRHAGDALQAKEDELHGAGVEGKNAEQRAAIVRSQTETERQALNAAEWQVSQARIRLRTVTNEMGCLKSVARLLEGGD